MSKDWSAAGFLWVNPPWHYLPGILRKLRKDCAQAIVIVPDMDWQTILAIKALAVQTLCLGPGMMFRRRPHLPFLPLPSWTVSACLFWPQATTWLKNLVTCGDVESNPGPMTFGEFTRTSFDDFLTLAPPLDMARTKVALAAKLRTGGEDLNAALSKIGTDVGEPPEGMDLLTCLAAFELFSQSTLDKSGATWTFKHALGPLEKELESLRIEMQKLKCAANPTPPKPVDLDTLKTLSHPNVATFHQQPSRPKWMIEMTEIFQTHVTDDDPHSDQTLQELWHCMVRYHFEYQTTYGSYRTTPASRNTAGPSLAEGLGRGGKIVFDRLNGRQVKFLELNGTRYYVAQRTGRLFDISQGPPSTCDNCGEAHWFWECTSQQK